MKKIFKLIALASILLVMMLCSFACSCSTPELESIVLSIEGATLSNGYYNIDKKDSSYTITTTLSSSEFDEYDLTWKSSNTKVATVYYNKLKTVGIGETTITATYKNSSGEEIKGTIRVNVNATSALITFPSGELVTTYNGYDQRLDFLANEDNGTSGLFTYQYYDYTTKQTISELKDAGKYKIICTSVSNSNVQTTKDITIEKRTLSFTSGNYQVYYGDALPTGLYCESLKPTDEEILDGQFNSITGVGSDGIIGKYINTTTAKQGSNVSTYKTSVYFVLKDNFKRNYSLDANITKGAINIIKKNVEIVLNPQTITYGNSIIANNYALYVYDPNNTTGEKVNLLEDSNVNYASNIMLGTPTYKKETSENIYEVAILNNSGVLDVRYNADGTSILPYKLFYESATTTSGNVEIKNIIASDITVNPREVTILPTVNQSKVYGTPDPQTINYSVVTSSFLSKDNIKPFLYIDYVGSGISVDNNNTDADTLNIANYNYNLNAKVGGYYYQIDNSQNKNYTITLHSLAQKVEGTTTEGKVVFNVTPCPIYIEVASVEEKYNTPKGSEETLFTISYFLDKNSSEKTKNAFNYSTKITSFVVNGNELVTHNQADGTYSIKNEYLGESFVEDGIINLIANKTPNSQTPSYVALESFKITLNLDNETKSDNYYAKYDIKPMVTSTGGTIGDTQSETSNYVVEFNNDITLTLNKIKLIVTPTQTEALFSKTYDAKDEIPQKDTFGFAYSAGNSNVYYTLSDSSLDITEILQNPNPLLTLSFTKSGQTKYIKLNDDGSELEVTNMISAGRYKVMMREISGVGIEGFISGFEYYDIILDDSKTYYYTVNPREVVVTPHAHQTKIYGAKDSNFAFSIDGLPSGVDYTPNKEGEVPTTIDGVGILGALTRVAGENVGSYAFTLGSLDFGKNYIVTLSETVVNYTITPRRVKITPVSYSLRYGDEEPSKLSFYEEIDESESTIDKNVLVNPTYTGNFVLKNSISDAQAVAKIGSFYPVRVDNDGKVLSYVICQGDFASDSNYTVIFINNSTYTVTPREIVINITSQQKEASDNIETEISGEFEKTNYTVSNLVDSPSYTLSDLYLTENDDKNAYYLIEEAGSSKFTFTISKNDQDISHCYTVTIGKNIVYTINVSVIYLAVINNSSTSSFVDYRYSGKMFENSTQNEQYFKLVCQTEGFIVDDVASQFSFAYSSLASDPVLPGPINVGSYRATLALNENDGDKIVIKKASTSQTIEFSSLSNEEIVENCVISISNIAYLNITKADMEYDSSHLAFEYSGENGLPYGCEDLPELLETINGEAIFKGVDGYRVTLKRYDDGLNYKLTSSNDDYTKFDANVKHSLNIIVDVAPVEDVDGLVYNYNTLNINVPLNIVPQKINYSSLSFYLSNQGTTKEEEIKIYNGYATTARFAIKNSSSEINYDNVNITNQYFKIQTIYEGENAFYAYKDWNNSTLGNEVKYDSYNESIFSNKTMNLYGNNEYIIVDNRALIVGQSSNVSPIDASFYVCISTAITDTNHIFYNATDSKEDGQSITASCIYEIKKSDNIEIEWNEENNNFFYTTVFNFDNVSSLEFVYSVPTVFREAVIFSNLKNKDGSEVEVPVNKMLNINSYTIDLVVETLNYYKSQNVKFEVKPLVAEIIIPTVNSFVYTGQPITSFLDDIGTILKDKDGYVVNTLYYISGNTDFSFEVIDINSEENGNTDEYSVTNMPKQSGEYEITITYDSANYFGTAVYKYSIINRTFTGSITFKNLEIVYNDDYNEDKIFNLATQNMFAISDTSISYNLELYWVKNSATYVLIGHNYKDSKYTLYYRNSVAMNSTDETSFEKFFSYGHKTLMLVVNFADSEYLQDRELSAILSINKYTLQNSNFAFAQNGISYNYDGYTVYHHLKYNGVELLPNPKESMSGYNSSTDTATFEVEDYEYELKNKSVTVKDKLGNEIFTLQYVYYLQNNSSGALTSLDEEVFPIVPNVNNKYKVEYNFRYGENYSGKEITYSSSLFNINKVNLYMSFTSQITMTYKPENTQQKIVELFNNNLRVANNDAEQQTNMKVNYCVGASTSSFNIYNGVHVRFYFAEVSQSSGVADPLKPLNTSTPLTVGKYKLYVTLLYNEGYVLTDFFNNIKLYGQDLITASDFMDESVINEDDNVEYIKCLSADFIVTKADSLYSINNYNDILSIDGTVEKDGTNKYLLISKTSTVECKISGYKLYLVDSNGTESEITSTFSLNDLNPNEEYKFKVVDDAGNYNDSHIAFKVE